MHPDPVPSDRVPRRVVLVVFEDLQVLDLTGPMEVFSTANRQAPGAPPYQLEVVSAGGTSVTATCGLRIEAAPLPRLDGEAIDTLVVVGGDGVLAAVDDDALVAWIAAAARTARRTAAVCSGAFLLARAGLLHGRRATTHWSVCGLLERTEPTTTVERDRIFVRDDPIWTSAGVTAGIDLGLALLEDDLGAEAARRVARWLVVFVQRPGGQAQFSAQLQAQRPEQPVLRDLLDWMPDHLDEDLTVAALARRVHMSTRTFARTFRREVGVTPAAHVESLRIEAARRLLETTDRGVADIARACGFGTVETLHRAFQRQVHVSPGAYRRRFASPLAAGDLTPVGAGR